MSPFPMKPVIPNGGQPVDNSPATQRHLAAQEKFKLAVQVILPLDFTKFIETMDHAESVGPFFAPTAWQEKHKDLAVDIAAARAIQECVLKLREVYKDAPAMKAFLMVREAMAAGEES